jgi:hypothetical protein
MPPEFADLLRRLRDRAGAGAIPCATREMIADAESELGFRLPPLLRAVYRFVGNGGFGPGVGRGLIGVPGTEPYLSTDDSVVDLYERELAHADLGDPADVWPERVLPVSDFGCASYACVDCSRRAGRVLLFDADRYLIMERPRRSRCLRQLCPTLEEWLEGWLLREPSG